MVTIPDRPLKDDDPALVLPEYTVVDGDWTYTKDRYGDWRATNGDWRTRLKWTLQWARQDVADRRLQRRHADGFWIDNIR